jgi:molybdopterin synthase catalytic subunit
MRIRVQAEDFDPGIEIDRLCNISGNSDDDSLAAGQPVGGVATFVGVVRGGDVRRMHLEHYPGMTERQLACIAEEAMKRWSLSDLTVIHRIGSLAVGERIVFVGTAAAGRAAAFAACEFIIDWLKTRAPIWKREVTDSGERWVTPREGDEVRADRWK